MPEMHPFLYVLVWLVVGGAVGAVGALVAGARGRARAERQRLQAARELAAAQASLESARSRRAEQDEEIRALRQGKGEAETLLAAARERIESAERAIGEQREFVETSRKAMEDAFGALASKALAGSTKGFLDLAEERFATSRAQAARDLDERRQGIELLLAPMRETLGRLERNTSDLEKAREGAYRGLAEQVEGLRRATATLEEKAGSLASALRGSGAQGRWGEIALRNVVELAGMSEHVDFVEQEDIGGKRPDMVVRLPGERRIAVDAKVSLNDYLEATAATTAAARDRALDRHVQSLRGHVRTLASREYADAVSGEVDLVVLFLPGDPFLSAAFERDPDIQTDALRSKVLIATPTTLVALLRTVAIYWQQRSLAENAQNIAEVARELYERAARFGEHLGRVGQGLDGAVDAFNAAVGSFERRFLPMGNRLRELKATDGAKRSLTAPARVEESTRRVTPADQEEALSGRSDDAPETLPLFPRPARDEDDED